MGVVSLVGPKNAAMFFAKKSKVVGSAFFFSGFLLIIIGFYFFTTIGFGLQMYGLYILFRSFIRTIFSYMQTLPVIGPCIRNSPFIHSLVDFMADGGKKNSGQSYFGGSSGDYGSSNQKEYDV
jgi:hypothetical protein